MIKFIFIILLILKKLNKYIYKNQILIWIYTKDKKYFFIIYKNNIDDISNKYIRYGVIKINLNKLFRLLYLLKLNR